MTRRMVVIAVAGSLACGAVVRAQSGLPAPGRPAAGVVDPVAGLALQDAVARALDQEPALRGARTEVDAARGMRLQSGLRPNPMVSFSRLEEPSGMDNQTRVEVAWPLDLFRRTARVAVADLEVEEARLTVADRERLLAAEVRVQYGEVAAAARELTVLDDLVALVSRQHALVAARVEQGAAPPLDRDMLRVEVQQLESERLLQQGAVEQALIGLKRTLGMAPDAPLTIRDDLEQLVRDEAGVPGDASGATRPDVDAAQVRVQAAEARIEQARRDGRADVTLSGMYMRMNAGFPQMAFGDAGGLEPIRGGFHYLAVGASLTVPLRNRNQGAVAAAQAQRAGESAQLDAARLTVRADLAAARVRDEHARRAVAVYTSGATALAKQNLAVVGQTYELGRATVFDVLAGQRRYLDLERAFTGALWAAYEARQALRRALGDVR